MAAVQRSKQATEAALARRLGLRDHGHFMNEVFGAPVRHPRPIPFYVTLGDVLDTEATDHCIFWHCYYSATKQKGTCVRKPCGRAACPNCLPQWLCDRIAPAWYVWNGAASWTLVEIDEKNDNTRRALPKSFKLRGKNATPGALALSIGGGRRLFVAPSGVLHNEIVAPELNTMLRDWARAIPAMRDPTDVRVPQTDSRVAYIKRREDLIRRLQLAGVEVTISGNEHIEYTATLEQWQIIRALRGAA